MNINNDITYAYSIKIYLLLIATACFCASIYFYHRSIFKSQSDINASFVGWKILIKRATPGTLFLIAFTLIVIFTVTSKMGSKATSKTEVDKNELRKSIESLKIDSTSNIGGKSALDIDSLIRSASHQASNKKYLNALRSLYIAKGYTYRDTGKVAYAQNIDQEINLFESILNEQINDIPQKASSEETRTTNISSGGKDSIR